MPKDDQSELFVVVDRNDKVIGYRSRYDCHHDRSLIHRGVEIVIFNLQGEVLLQKRSKDKDLYPGFYTISTGGHVMKGETYVETAERELFEELGIKTRLAKVDKMIIDSEFETEMDVIFKGIYNGPVKMDSSEVEEVGFYSSEKLVKIKNLLTPFSKTVLAKLKII